MTREGDLVGTEGLGQREGELGSTGPLLGRVVGMWNTDRL